MGHDKRALVQGQLVDPADDAGAPEDAAQPVTLAALLDSAAVGKLLRGQFTLYKTPEGGLHIAYRLEGQDEDGHLPLPPALIKLGMAAASGKGPLALLGRIMP